MSKAFPFKVFFGHGERRSSLPFAEASNKDIAIKRAVQWLKDGSPYTIKGPKVFEERIVGVSGVTSRSAAKIERK